jgi:hypothetical protein
MAFPHPKSRKEHDRKEDKPSSGGVVWNVFERTIDISEDRNAADEVNRANNRTFGAIFHDELCSIYRRYRAPFVVDQLLALDLFKVTAARTRVFNASSSIASPSWRSMARLVFPSRLELKRRDGSFRAAPLAKVIFTTFL